MTADTRAEAIWRRRKRRAFGLGLKLLATAAMLVVYIGIKVGGVAAFLCALPLLLALAWIFHFVDRLVKDSAEAIMAKDRRAPILFLRPFDSDAVRISRPGLIAQIFVAAPFPWELATILPRLTFEEALVNILQSSGPVVALGHPANPIEPVGAARTYAGNEWQSRVEVLAEKAAAVVILPDDRPSVIWELRAIRRKCEPRRILLVPGAGPAQQSAWEGLRTQVDYLPPIVPETAIISFDDRGLPHLENARSASPRDRLRTIERAVRLDPNLRGRSHLNWLSRSLRFTTLVLWTAFLPALFTWILYHAVRLEWGLTTATIFFSLVIVAASSTSRIPFGRAIGLDTLVKPIRTHDPFRWARPRLLFIASVAILIVVRGMFLQAFIQKSGSMLPTAGIGDQIFVNKLAFGIHYPVGSEWIVHTGNVERGDPVVYTPPKDLASLYFHRVVAIGGDRVRIRGGIVSVNGIVLEQRDPVAWSPAHDPEASQLGTVRGVVVTETSLSGRRQYSVLHLEGTSQLNLPDERSRFLPGLRCTMEECLVQPGHVFLLGDNRGNSTDSCVVGAVPTSFLVGRVFMVW